jgi:hypothetical protein
MFKGLRSPLTSLPTNIEQRSQRWACPQLEALEDRTVPTITYHGGNLLYNVEVQGVYLGSDWYYNSTYNQQTGFFEGFLGTMVQSSQMDALTRAGYGVGRGSADPGQILLENTGNYIYDSDIHNFLQNAIDHHQVLQPDANRLYVVFVQDNVVVDDGNGATSQNAFLAYHGAFGGSDAFGSPADIRYAVIPYHGGWIGNAQNPNLSTLDSMTVAASHEIIEAATDPDVNYKTLGWYDDDLNGENADITNGSTMYIGGYAMQRVPDLYDQAMTPAGAAPVTQVSFVLQPNGWLWEHSSVDGWIFLSSGIARVSDQGIDFNGRGFVGLVTDSGDAYEYHDGSGFNFLWYGATDARAGQAVTYVLFNDTSVWEYDDASGNWNEIASGGAASIDAGTDAQGVNAVGVLAYNTQLWVHSDATGWEYLAGGVRQFSMGQQGFSVAGGYDFSFWMHSDKTGQWSYLTSNVIAGNIGVDAYGLPAISVVTTWGAWYQFDWYTGWTYQAGSLSWLSKEHNGVYEVVGVDGNYYEHGGFGGWAYLGGDVYAAC